MELTEIDGPSAFKNKPGKDFSEPPAFSIIVCSHFNSFAVTPISSEVANICFTINPPELMIRYWMI